MRKTTEIMCEGVNLFLADGAVAGQDVFHAHLHIRPRYAGDEVRSQYPAGFEKRPKPSRETLNSLAAAIKCNL
jgi:diadenosine tetraphosphate (Ap4A) HIT family hydrolase